MCFIEHLLVVSVHALNIFWCPSCLFLGHLLAINVRVWTFLCVFVSTVHWALDGLTSFTVFHLLAFGQVFFIKHLLVVSVHVLNTCCCSICFVYGTLACHQCSCLDISSCLGKRCAPNTCRAERPTIHHSSVFR